MKKKSKDTPKPEEPQLSESEFAARLERIAREPMPFADLIFDDYEGGLQCGLPDGRDPIEMDDD